MGRRAAVLIAAIGIVAGVGWARATFVASAVVPVRESLIGGPGRIVGDEQVWVRCNLDGSNHHSLEDGGPMFSNGTEPIPPPADPICEAARNERLPTSAAIAVLGLGLAALVVASDQASRRRAIDRRVEAMAAERAAGGSPPDPVAPPDAAGTSDR